VLLGARARACLAIRDCQCSAAAMLFESHTDSIVKDRRDTFYGHEVFVTGGASGLILDCKIERGNPSDSTMALPMLEQQTDIYGRPPRQAAMDCALPIRGLGNSTALSCRKPRW
jgi:hypothetical protein